MQRWGKSLHTTILVCIVYYAHLVNRALMNIILISSNFINYTSMILQTDGDLSDSEDS